METLISIVVPIFNVEEYLDRCVQSLVDQTYENLEIILVDDGSTDSCPAKCDMWEKKDMRIKTIHKTNGGLGFARNTGIEYASGEYIFFIDSDDYVDCSMVEKCLKSACEHNCDVVMFGRNDDFNGIIKSNRIIEGSPCFSGYTIQNMVLPSLFTYDMGIGTSACMKMFKLSVIRENNIKFKSEREIISEDSYFALEFFSKVSVASVVSENLYYYYKREASLTKEYKPDRQKMNDKFLNICLQYVFSAGLSQELSNHIMARYHGLTLGNLMQITKSGIALKEKFNVVKSIIHSNVVRNTLSFDVIKWDANIPKIFWICLKLRLYMLCYLLLIFNGF